MKQKFQLSLSSRPGQSFRVVLDVVKTPLVKDLANQISTTFEVDVLALYAIEAGLSEEKVTLTTNQELDGLLSPADKLFAESKERNANSFVSPPPAASKAPESLPQQPNISITIRTFHARQQLLNLKTSRTATLVQLKRLIATKLGVKGFSPDCDPKEVQKAAVEDEVTLSVRTLAGTVEVKVQPSLKLEGLTSVFSANIDGCSPTDIHTILLRNRPINSYFSDSSSAFKSPTVSDLLSIINGHESTVLDLFGLGEVLQPMSKLETWTVRVTSVGAQLTSLLSKCRDCTVEILNPLLASTVSTSVATVGDLKQSLFDKFFAKHAYAHDMMSVDDNSESGPAAAFFKPSDFRVSVGGVEMNDASTLTACGIGSLTNISISSQVFEEWAASNQIVVTYTPVYPQSGAHVPSGNASSFICLPNETVGDVKNKLLQLQGKEGTRYMQVDIITGTAAAAAADDKELISSHADAQKLTLRAFYQGRETMLNFQPQKDGKSKTRTTCALALETHFLQSTAISDRASITEWGIAEGTTVYAVFFPTSSAFSSETILPLASYGKQNLFSADEVWRSAFDSLQQNDNHTEKSRSDAYDDDEADKTVQNTLAPAINAPKGSKGSSQSVFLQHTDKGICACLSSLRSLSEFCGEKGKKSACDNFLSKLASLGDREFLPLVNALFLMMRTTSSIKNSHRAFISQGLHALCRKMAGCFRSQDCAGGDAPSLPETHIMESVRYTLNYVLRLSESPGYAGSLVTETIEFDVDQHQRQQQEHLKLASPDQAKALVFRHSHEKRKSGHKGGDDAMDLDDDDDEDGPGGSDTFPVLTKAQMRVKYMSAVFTCKGALSLRSCPPPQLTLDSLGNLVTFTGRGKGSAGSLTLSSPLTGDISTTDQELAEQQKQLTELNDEVHFSEAKEVIVICLDSSGSMGKSAKFPGQIDSFIDRDSDAHWEWDSESNDAKAGLSKDALTKALDSIRLSKCLRILQSLASKYSPDIILRELCRIYSASSPRDNSLFYLISQHMDKFVALLITVHLDDDELELVDKLIPHKFLCPISHELMKNPVIAADGNVYDKDNIERWLLKQQTSPLFGTAMSHTRLTEARTVRQEIETFIAAAGDVVASSGSSSSGSSSGAAQMEQDDDDDDESATQAGMVTLVINVQGVNLPSLPADVPRKFSVTIAQTATGLDLRKLIVRQTRCKVVPTSLIFNAITKVLDEKTLQTYDITSTRARTFGVTHNVIARVGTRSRPCEVIMKNGRNDLVFSAQSTDLVESLYFRLWDRLGNMPSTTELWDHHSFKETGDNYRTGVPLDDPKMTLELAMRDATETKPFTLEIMGRRQSSKQSQARLTRVQTVSQLFHAFLNRSEAYDCHHHVGLITFSDKPKLTGKISPIFDEFKTALDHVKTNGDTCLYAAVKLANEEIASYCQAHPDVTRNCKRRILILSDGDDTKSALSAIQAAKLCLDTSTTVDVICIGDVQEASEYAVRSISIATGGYQLFPRTLKEALHLSELETFLSISERDPSLRPVSSPNINSSTFQRLMNREFDTADNASRKPELMLERRVVTLAKSLHFFEKQFKEGGGKEGGGQVEGCRSRESTRRILKQMQELNADPHPSFSVLPAEDDIGFWRVLCDGPSGTPYANGVWLLYIKFPTDYPSSPPTARFVTPISHCNINSQGRVCHSIFNENWSTEMTARKILECIFGLLLSPDTSDPLDSTLALKFYDDSGLYEADIVEHTRLNASVTREEWLARFAAQSATVDDNLNTAGLELERGTDALMAMVGLLTQGAHTGSSSQSSTSSTNIASGTFQPALLARTIAQLSPFLANLKPRPDSVPAPAPVTARASDLAPAAAASSSSSSAVEMGGTETVESLFAQAEAHLKRVLAVLSIVFSQEGGCGSPPAQRWNKYDAQLLHVKALFNLSLLHFAQGEAGFAEAARRCTAAISLGESRTEPLENLPATYSSLFHVIKLHIDVFKSNWLSATSASKSLKSLIKSNSNSNQLPVALLNKIIQSVDEKIAAFKDAGSGTTTRAAKKAKH